MVDVYEAIIVGRSADRQSLLTVMRCAFDLKVVHLPCAAGKQAPLLGRVMDRVTKGFTIMRIPTHATDMAQLVGLAAPARRAMAPVASRATREADENSEALDEAECQTRRGAIGKALWAISDRAYMSLAVHILSC